MTQLIVKSPVYYAGRTRRVGEVFEAPAAHAKVLLRTNTVALHIAELEGEPAPKLRRQYRRRDMAAGA